MFSVGRGGVGKPMGRVRGGGAREGSLVERLRELGPEGGGRKGEGGGGREGGSVREADWPGGGCDSEVGGELGEVGMGGLVEGHCGSGGGDGDLKARGGFGGRSGTAA